MHSCGIAVDTQSNIYVSDGSAITAFTNTGQPAGIIPETGRATAFALDKSNNVYVLVDDKVIKRAAIQ